MNRTNLLIVLIATIASPASAQTFGISWSTIDGGGGFSNGGSFELDGTIGQPEAGAMSGGNFELVGGFWGGAASTPNPCPGDADSDLDVDITDLGLVLSQFGMTGTGLAGDVDGDNDVDITDLGIVLANFGASCL